MILILCNTFQEAIEDFKLFKEYLFYTASDDIQKIHNAGLCIETVDDLLFMFVDRRYYRWLRKLKADTIDELQFMAEIYDFFNNKK